MQEKKSRTVPRLREMISVLRQHDIVRGVTPEKMRVILEDLGPTFVKMGQIMSMRPDVFPSEYCTELKKLQTEARPIPFDTILKVLEEEYQRDWKSIFVSVDEEVLGSASIAQVHRALLRSGERVVIKVQRPGIYRIMEQDIALLRCAAKIVRIFTRPEGVVDFQRVLDEMWAIARQEMDFLVEADHIEEFRALNKDEPHVTCPIVFHELTTRHVLVLEYIDGVRIDDFDGLHARGWDERRLGRYLAENFVKQILEDGYFHADPHPGNLWVRGGHIVWLDLGMMGRLARRDRMALRKAVQALAGRDTFEMKEAVLALGIARGKINHALLYQDIDTMMAQMATLDFKSMQMGLMAEQITNILRAHRIACPAWFSLFARSVMTLEAVLQKCCPELGFVELFAQGLIADFEKRFRWRDALANVKREGYTIAHKTVQIPEQLSTLLKMTMNGQTRVNIDVKSSEEILSKLDKMLNRLVLAVLSSALLLGSSTICTTNMTPKIMEIPLLGVAGYLIAFVLSLRLLWEILKSK